MKPEHLYLFTLEVVPMQVGKVYNPLPSHLTLMSRFWSSLSAEQIVGLVMPLFAKTAPIELVFGEPVDLGPKQTPVHMIVHSQAIKDLHNRLKHLLDEDNVRYEAPQFVGGGHKPHVSRRSNDGFSPGNTLVATAVYLIEVKIEGPRHQRYIRAKFDLQDTDQGLKY